VRQMYHKMGKIALSLAQANAFILTGIIRQNEKGNKNPWDKYRL
jgi:hypothetical protein